MKNIIYIIGIISGLTFCLSSVFMSCSSDDFNTKELIAYFPVGQKHVDVGQYNILKVNSGLTTNFKLPINITRPLDKDVNVVVSINLDLLEEYNSKYAPETPIEAFPEGLFSLERNGKTIIQAGKTTSEPLFLNIGNSEGIDDSKLYVIPLEIEFIEKGIPISTNRSVLFAEISITSVQLGITTTDELNEKHITLNSIAGEIQNYSPIFINASLSNKLDYDSKVEVRINNDLISQYNEKNNTQYVPFPKGSCKLLNSKTIIPAFSQLLKEEIQLTYDPKVIQSLTQYMIPIELLAIDEKNQPFLYKNKTVVYLSIDKFENYIDSESTKIDGKIMDRSKWKLSTTISSSEPLENLIDGDIDTYWEGDWNNTNFTLDMGEDKYIKGFILSMHDSGCVKSFDFYISNNGQDWNCIGSYFNEEQSDRVIKFTKSLKGRYFKFENFELLDDWDLFPRIAEINAYE